jgi:hypothetical protein
LCATVAAIAVLAIIAAVALPRLVDTPRVQSLIASQAAQVLGRPVTFASMSVSLLPLPAVELKDLQVADDPKFGTTPFLKLQTFALRLRLRPLLAGRVEFGDLILKKPVIAVVQDGQGRWNFATLGAAPEPRTPSSKPRSGGGGGASAPFLADVKLEDGVVLFSMRRPGGAAQTVRVENLDLNVESGTGVLGFKGSARVTPGDLDLKFTDGRVARSAGKALTEAALTGKVSLDGRQVKELATVVVGPEPAVAGAVKGTLTLGGVVGNPRAAGDLTLSDAAITQTQPNCAAPKQRTLKLDTLTLNLVYEDAHLSLRPLTTGIGGGAVTSNVVATLEGGTHVQVRDLGIKALPLQKVLVDYLCQGYAVTGPLDTTGGLSFDARDLWNTLGGSGQFKIGPGKVVGAQALALLGGITRVGGALSSLLAADLPTSLFSSPLDFESITGTYQIAKGVLTTRDLLYTSRAMTVAIAGDYALGSGRMNLAIVMNHGRAEIQASVTGTAASPSIRVNPAATLKALDPGQAKGGLDDLLRRFTK